jgi:predicted ferric reductase
LKHIAFSSSNAITPALSLKTEMHQSLFSTQREAYWDLARSSGIVAYLLVWLSVAFGLIITNRMARVWPGGPTAFDLHQFASLLGLAFAVFHGLILLGDQYINFSLPQILIPFASANYKTLWVGLGQLAFYALIPITFSFYVRRQISAGVWRAIHYLSFVAFSMITVHGLLAGSDTASGVMLGLYAMTGLSVIALTLYRMMTMVRAAA